MVAPTSPLQPLEWLVRVILFSVLVTGLGVLCLSSGTRGEPAHAAAQERATIPGTPAPRERDRRLLNGKLRDSIPPAAPFPPASASPSPTCTPYWSYIQNYQVGASWDHRGGIAAISSGDVWLVGYNSSSAGQDTQTQHWDGSRWSIVPSPNGDFPNNSLHAISALASNDVWAVGSSYGGTGQAQPLVIRWNGAQWQRIAVNVSSLPNPELQGVLAISANDVWAVGSVRQDGNVRTQTLTIHWNGTTWSVVPSPNYDNANGGLKGISATAPNDVWAVGTAYNSAEYRNVTLTLHWTGTAWSLVTSPNWNFYDSYLESVSALSPDDAWAAGYIYTPSGGTPLVLHWNGTVWARVQSPYVPSYSAFEKVVARAPNDVWFAGSANDGTVIERWDGSTWTRMTTPNSPNGRYSSLGDLNILSDNEAWAAGEYLDLQNNNTHTFTLHYAEGPCPTPTFSPTATRTPSTVTPTVTATVTPDCSLPWQIWPAPGGGGDTLLTGVTAIASNDVWAVGYRRDEGQYGTYRTLILHWNGTQWNIVPSPNANLSNNFLYAVSAVSASDIWAVGAFWPSSSSISTLTMHWDGQSWQIVFSPNADYDWNWLLGVSARAPNDVWAVGTFNMGPYYNTFAEHWDGFDWTVIYTPNYYEIGDALYGVAAVAQDNIWAAGSSDYYNLIEHSNGQNWNLAAIPHHSDREELSGIAAINANDIWSVGYYDDGADELPLAMHWNGAGWSLSTMPYPGPGYTELNAVSFSSSNNVWAAGQRQVNSIQGSIYAHWNGQAWQVYPGPNLGTDDNSLTGIAMVSQDDGWAVGYYVEGPVRRALIQRFVGATCQPSTPTVTPAQTSTATATATVPASSTATRTATPVRSATPTTAATLPPLTSTPTPTGIPSGTPSSTPTTYATAPVGTSSPTTTPCEMRFSDVGTGDFFYVAVRYLYCHAVISGYADGTFRPYSETTRGQLSKIVVLAEAWSTNTTGGPHFADVPTSNPFYAFVETAYNRGIISGYSDGTFRWGSNVTRGQLSKIVALAREWPINTTGGPHFSDVPISSPFYAFIETAYNRGIISGYSDGTFRPNYNATRGQIAKIVYQALSGP